MLHSCIWGLSQLCAQSPELALFLSVGLGCWVGRFKVGAFQLGGVAGSLLVAVLVSQLGVHIDSGIKTVLFVLFIYAVGYQSGPGFFRSLGRQSLREVVLAIVLAVSGLATVIALGRWFHLDKGMAAGLGAGGLTQSAMIGTAGAALEKLGLPAAQVQVMQGHVAVGYAVTYIFGSVGTIIFCVNILPLMMRRNMREDAIAAELAQASGTSKGGNDSGVASSHCVGRVYAVTSDKETPSLGAIEEAHPHVAVERVKHHGRLVEIAPQMVPQRGDLVLLVGPLEAVIQAGASVGEERPSSPDMSMNLIRQDIVLKPSLIGHGLDDALHMATQAARHEVYPVSVSRAGQNVPMTSTLKFQQGDILTILGGTRDVKRAGQTLGGLLGPQTTTDLVYNMFGLAVGLLIGLVVIRFGNVPITLGSGGGALLSGLLFGWWHGRHPSYGAMPSSVCSLLSSFGLAGFVAVTGLQTGRQAIETIATHGLTLLLLGVVVTIVPLVITALVGRYLLGYRNSALFAGALAGTRSSNPAFGEILAKAGNNTPTIPFAITYAVANVLLTLLGPLIVAFV